MSAKYRLLIVDDIPVNRDLLTRFFEGRGFETVEASCAMTALHKLKQTRFDAVFLDILMPEVDGIELLTIIRAQHTPNELPVIMVSALSARDDIKLALDLGANDYITKPVDFASALTKLRRVLRPQIYGNQPGDKARNRREMRKRSRRQLQCAAWLVLDEAAPPIECKVNDLSDSGACVALKRLEALPKELTLLLVENGSVYRKGRVIWQRGLNIGIEFIGGLAHKERLQAGSLIDCRF
jgi:DNA-binding response OmpR family regulator